MSRPPIDQLSAAQQDILACAQIYPGQFTRSGLAKLLAGSRSPRSSELSTLPEYGRLAERGRKAITFEIDILLQQGYLALDAGGRLVPAGAR
jgi:hypothetical protein